MKIAFVRLPTRKVVLCPYLYPYWGVSLFIFVSLMGEKEITVLINISLVSSVRSLNIFSYLLSIVLPLIKTPGPVFFLFPLGFWFFDSWFARTLYSLRIIITCYIQVVSITYLFSLKFCIMANKIPVSARRALGAVVFGISTCHLWNSSFMILKLLPASQSASHYY